MTLAVGARIILYTEIKDKSIFKKYYTIRYYIFTIVSIPPSDDFHLKVCISFQHFMLKSSVFLVSPPEEYSVSLSSNRVRSNIGSLCAYVTVCMHVWVAVSHTLIVLSYDADINLSVLKERQRDVTKWVCPCNVAMHVLVAVSHTLMTPSIDPEYSLLPSSERQRLLRLEHSMVYTHS